MGVVGSTPVRTQLGNKPPRDFSREDPDLSGFWRTEVQDGAANRADSFLTRRRVGFLGAWTQAPQQDCCPAEEGA